MLSQVDLDPKIGGEHVNMLYLATYENSESKVSFMLTSGFMLLTVKL